MFLIVIYEENKAKRKGTTTIQQNCFYISVELSYKILRRKHMGKYSQPHIWQWILSYSIKSLTNERKKLIWLWNKKKTFSASKDTIKRIKK